MITSLILSLILQPTEPVSSCIASLNHRKFQQREHATEYLRRMLYRDGDYNYKLMIQLKWILFNYKFPPESERRLNSLLKDIWANYLNVGPTYYWKFPWIGKNECPDIHKDQSLLAEARKMSVGRNTGHYEYFLYRAAGKVYARRMLLSGKMTRQQVQHMIDRWVIEEVNWYLDKKVEYFINQIARKIK